jgi:hypothetical protein
MVNIWLAGREIRRKFPLNAKVQIDWSGHPLDSAQGKVVGFAFYCKNRVYLMDIEVAVWTMLHGNVNHQIPWNHLKRI